MDDGTTGAARADDALEAAWTTFRRGLADWMGAGGLAVLAVLDPARVHLAQGPALVHLASSRGTVSARLESEPHDPEPVAAFPLVRPAREADLVAVRVVEALRNGFGVLHPALLDPTGLPAGLGVPAVPDLVESELDRRRADDERPLTVRVRTPDHLLDLVTGVLGDVEPDDDGDLPVPAGDLEVVFVRVHHHRAVVELFCHLAIDVELPERLPDELDILNRSDLESTYFSDDGVVTMRRVLPSTFFVAGELRLAVARMCHQVGLIGADLRRRVGGRSFLGTVDREGADPGRDAAVGTGDDEHGPSAGLVQLLELLHAGPVPPAVVAELYDHDRHALVRDTVACRRDGLGCEVHDQDVLLAHLRAALRHVATRAAEVRGTGGPAPRRVVSQQLSLIADDDLGAPTLPVERAPGTGRDHGQWGA